MSMCSGAAHIPQSRQQVIPMDTIEGRRCGNCKAAVRANVRGMEGMLWCQPGHAAAQSGVSCVESVFINPQRPGCEKHALRVDPIPEASTSEESAPTGAADEGRDVEARPSEEPVMASREAPHGKEGSFPSGYFL